MGRTLRGARSSSLLFQPLCHDHFDVIVAFLAVTENVETRGPHFSDQVIRLLYLPLDATLWRAPRHLIAFQSKAVAGHMKRQDDVIRTLKTDRIL
jgi:hypothetical protein